MIVFPIGLFLTIAAYSNFYITSNDVVGAPYSMIGAFSLFFLTILPLLIILTKVPSGIENEPSPIPTRAEQLAAKFAKIVGSLLLVYFAFMLLLILGMLGG